MFGRLLQIPILNKLLDKHVRSCEFLIPGLKADLGHRHVVSSLCMLYKIYQNPRHPLSSELPDFFQPARIARYALRENSLAFAAVRYNTEQYKRRFNQNFKTGVNDYLRRCDR